MGAMAQEARGGQGEDAGLPTGQDQGGRDGGAGDRADRADRGGSGTGEEGQRGGAGAEPVEASKRGANAVKPAAA